MQPATPREPVTDLSAILPAIRPLPADAVVSGTTAATLHGLWLPPAAMGRPVELTVPGRDAPPRQRHHTRLGVVRHRRRTLLADEVTVVDGVPVTTLARTWLDLSETLCPADLLALGDAAARIGLTPADLSTVIGRAGHRRGVRRARQVALMIDARSRSRPESWLRYGLISYGLPVPDVNVAVVVDGEWIGEPDLSYRRARLGIEYQGEEHATLSRMRKDITRSLSFHDVDWLLLPAGPSQVFTFPDMFLRRVAFELRRRTGADRTGSDDPDGWAGPPALR